VEGYGLGKDIQMILTRLDRVEVLLAAQGRSPCKGRQNRGGKLTMKAAAEVADMRSKTGHAGRSDSGECECQQQSITIWEDGRYEYTSSQYNHSHVPDDGDTHRMTVYIYAGGEIVHSFSCDRFVPRYDERVLSTSGQSDRLRERFDSLDSFKGDINCD
jgi:hypothetical protein